jgi:hypothetical protein
MGQPSSWGVLIAALWPFMSSSFWADDHAAAMLASASPAIATETAIEALVLRDDMA